MNSSGTISILNKKFENVQIHNGEHHGRPCGFHHLRYHNYHLDMHHNFSLVIFSPAFRALANASMLAFVASREKFATYPVSESESSGVLSDKLHKLGY